MPFANDVQFSVLLSTQQDCIFGFSLVGWGNVTSAFQMGCEPK